MTTITSHMTDTVTDHYLLAGLWADASDEAGEQVEDAHVTYSPPDVDSRDAAREAVAAFLAEATQDAEAWAIITADAEQAGHDLWLSANGHGAGFWDRGHGAAGDRLHEMAKRLGSATIIIGAEGPDYVRG